MTTVAEAFVTLRPNSKGFAREAETGIAAPMKKLALAVGGAFAAAKVKDFLGGAIGEAREAIRVTAQTEQVIKSTGRAANLTAKEFETLAESISKKVGVDDEQIQSAENMLATFTKVRNEAGKGNKVFNAATKAIVDMSAVQGDLEGNARLVGKALQDPVKGVTALQRVGVRLSEQQKQQVKDFVAVNDIASAQKVILKELNVEFGGQAAAQATSAQKMSVAWGNLQESLGKKLIPVMEKITGFLVEHEDLLPPLITLVGVGLVAAFASWTASLWAAVTAEGAVLAPILAVGAAIAALIVGLKYAYDNWGAFHDAVDRAWQILQVVWDVVTKVAYAIYDLGRKVVQFLLDWTPVGQILQNLPEILGFVRDAFQWVIDKVQTLIEWIKKLPGIIDKALGPIDEIIAKAGKAFSSGSTKNADKILREEGFLKGRASGGWVGAGQLVKVNEFGTEGWIPNSGGSVIPLGKMAGVGEVNQHFYGDVDPNRVRSATSQGLRDAAWLMGG